MRRTEINGQPGVMFLPTKGEPAWAGSSSPNTSPSTGSWRHQAEPEPFERVGWTDDFSRGPAGDTFKIEETMASDAQLLGRVTYDTFAAVWPHIEGEFADKFNTMPKYVVSSTLENPEWKNTTVLRGDAVEEVGKLKQRYERDIVVHGSPQLAQTLIEHDLVDELCLMVYPVIVGAGKRLFAETTHKKNLRLVETKTFNDGIHVLIYRPPNR